MFVNRLIAGVRGLLAKDFVLVWLILVATGLWLRPLTPVDETRAATVAWEMWNSGNFLVPHLNGQPYSHKPPLLQWSMHALWLLFGVNEWAARLAAPLFGLANLLLSAALARRLWPQDRAAERLVPWLLLAMPIWAIWTSLTLYDMLVTCFTLLGMLGVVRAAAGEQRWSWSLLALAIGGGILSKGPAILLLALPTALLAPWWMERKPKRGWGSWYRGMGAAIGAGALLGLAWAVPAGLAGGEEYRNLIFWGQSAGRIANSFAHKRPLWWYLELMPILLFPWFWWPPLWRGLRTMQIDAGQRFCLVQMGFVLAAFSLISGKQVHYLLPAYPAAALLFARRLGAADAAPSPWARLPVAVLVLLAGLVLLALALTPWAGGNGTIRLVAEAPLVAKLMVLASGLALLLWPFRSSFAAIRGVTLMVLVVLIAAHVGFREIGMRLFDLAPISARLAEVEAAGAPLANWRKYSGEFGFLGRLTRTIAEVDNLPALEQWLNSHPDGYLVVRTKLDSPVGAGVVFSQPFKGSRRIELWRADAAALRLRSGASWAD